MRHRGSVLAELFRSLAALKALQTGADAMTSARLVTLAVGESPVNSAFLPDGSGVYVTNQKSGTVSVIETEGWTVTKTLEVGTNPFGLYLFDPTSGQMAGNR